MYDVLVGQSRSASAVSSNNVMVSIHEAPKGTHVEQYFDEEKQEQIIRIVCGDIRMGGDLADQMGSTFGLSRKGYI